MRTQTFLASAALAVGLFLLPTQAQASRVRYHYVQGKEGIMVLDPVAGGAPGLRLSWIGRAPVPFECAPKPTRNMCFTHTCTGKQVIVPLQMPLDTEPIVEHRPNGVSFNYGSDCINVNFLPDGTVNVVYDTGLFREAYTSSHAQ